MTPRSGARDRQLWYPLDNSAKVFPAIRKKHISAAFPGLPMIMLTGVYEYMDDAWKQAFDADKSWLPVHRFMEKPVSPTVLLYEAESILKDKHH